jgi:5-(carboxyamino)imidazole ribonucleotide synthase
MVQPMNSNPTAPVGLVGGRASVRSFERAARDLGIELIIFTPDQSGQLEEIGANAPRSTVDTLDDLVARAAVITVGYGCDHRTFCALMDVAERRLQPNASALHLSHDPLAARYVFQDSGFAVAEFEEVDSGDTDAVERFGRRHGWPVRLRGARWGSAEPAVHLVWPFSALDQAWADSGGQLWLLEAYEPLAPRIAVVIARRPSGQQVVYPVIADTERNCRPPHLLPLAAALEEHAISTAKSIADGLDATGIVTVRFLFGHDGRLLVDDFVCGPEMCPLTDVAAVDSLVAVHLRAILDWHLDRASDPTEGHPFIAPVGTSIQQRAVIRTSSRSGSGGNMLSVPKNGTTAMVRSFEQPARDAEVARWGIVGSGQQARMMLLAAARLGVEVSVLAHPTDEATRSMLPHVMIGDPADPGVLDEFTRRCEVVTFDDENVDPEVIDALTRLGRVVRPGAVVLRACDRAFQRTQLAALGFAVPPFTVASNPGEIITFARSHGGWPVVAKIRRGGHESRGARFVDGEHQAVGAYAVDSDVELVIEPALAIERELAVLVARRPGGDHVVYPIVESHRRNFVSDSLLAPADLEPDMAIEAASIAVEIAHAFEAVGILAVEFYVVDGRLIVNELASGTHNIGQFTIEGCVTSQFEHHLRAVLDLPLGSTALVAPAVATVNVLGRADGVDLRARTAHALASDRAHLHLYADQARQGRTLGHVTVLDADPQIALARALQARAAFSEEPG